MKWSRRKKATFTGPCDPKIQLFKLYSDCAVLFVYACTHVDFSLLSTDCMYGYLWNRTILCTLLPMHMLLNCIETKDVNIAKFFCTAEQKYSLFSLSPARKSPISQKVFLTLFNTFSFMECFTCSSVIWNHVSIKCTLSEIFFGWQTTFTMVYAVGILMIHQDYVVSPCSSVHVVLQGTW